MAFAPLHDTQKHEPGPDIMPLYEYENAEDGEVITLLRSMADADKPVEDPEGKGRTFRRRHSVFGVGGGSGAAQTTGSDPGAGAPTFPGAGCCPCGKGAGACSHAN